jgi:hypothetical protein
MGTPTVLPNSAWYFVHGNAAVREVTDNPLDVESIEIGRRFGWGSQFWVTRDTANRGRNIFHFPIPAPLFMSIPTVGGPSFRAHIAQVAVQGNFGPTDTNTGGGSQLRWIDVWEGNNRVFTTSPEGPDGRRTSQLTLTGDFSNRFSMPTGPQDRPLANVHVVGTGFSDTPIAFRGINISVGVEILGDHRILFTNVGVFLMFFPG